MGDWSDECRRRKYAPVPEDAPRHKKKAEKRHVRSDHRHEYEDVAVIEPHSCEVVCRDGRHKAYHKASRCKICGRLYDVKFHAILNELPDGMRVFEVDRLTSLFDKYLPDDKERH